MGPTPCYLSAHGAQRSCLEIPRPPNIIPVLGSSEAPSTNPQSSPLCPKKRITATLVVGAEGMKKPSQHLPSMYFMPSTQHDLSQSLQGRDLCSPQAIDEQMKSREGLSRILVLT